MAESDPAKPELSSALLPPVSHAGDYQKMGVDDMLQKFCGEFGQWQLRHFVLTSLAWLLEAFHGMVMIFADREPAWRCVTPNFACLSATSVCNLDKDSWEWIGGPSGSTISHWGLVCAEKYKVGLVQSAFFIGCLIGAGIFGHLSDSFLGRKGSLVVICFFNGILGCLTATSPTYWVYFLLRLLTGISVGGVGLCTFVLAIEPVGPTKRGTIGMSSFYFFSGGIAVLSGLAYIFQSWRALYIATSLPSLIFLVAILPFLSESPRWYLIRGRDTEAMKVMRSIAMTNGNCLPDGISIALDVDVAPSHAVSGTLIDIIQSPVTRKRLVIMVLVNFTCAISYYGLTLNVANLQTNLYLNVFLNAVFELPAFPITALLVLQYGRKPLVLGTMVCSGAFCMVGSVLRNVEAMKTVWMTCGMMGIFFLAGTYNLLAVYMAELFPTAVRNAALGCVQQAVKFGAILAPMVVVIGGGWPFAVFAVCGIAGGLLSLYTPETMYEQLYDTIAGLEESESRKRASA